MSTVVAAEPVLARVTVVIINYNSGPWLARCLRTLRPPASRLPRVVVLDNASSDHSLGGVPEQPGIGVRRLEHNAGFGPGVNHAAEAVDSDYMLIINPDCLLVPAALEQLARDLDRHEDAAMVSGRVFDMKGNEQRASRRQLPTRRRVLNEVLPFRGQAGLDLTHEPAPVEAGEVEAVSGACMLVRTAAFRDVGGFDPGYPMHFEDLDLMARLRAAGWRIRQLPEVAVSHAGGVSSSHRRVHVLWAKHRGLWRYLHKHCRREWSWWRRAGWWLTIYAHAVVMTPITLLTRR